MEIAVLALGCFWGPEIKFSKINGVIKTEVGYCGGNNSQTTYKEVCTGNTNHAEVVKIDFDENKISFLEILNYFWDSHDPTQLNRQGPDIGTQYRSIIFCYDNIQLEEAKKSKELKQLSMKNNIVTEIAPFKEFFIAEDYHQLFICKRA